MKESSKYLSLKGRGTNNVLVFDTNRYMGEEEYLSLSWSSIQTGT